MDFKEYQQEAEKTIKSTYDNNFKTYLLLKIMGEMGEAMRVINDKMPQGTQLGRLLELGISASHLMQVNGKILRDGTSAQRVGEKIVTQRFITDLVSDMHKWGDLPMGTDSDLPHDINMDRLKEEIGDVLWYVSALCTAFGLNLYDVAQQNIVKLRSRHLAPGIDFLVNECYKQSVELGTRKLTFQCDEDVPNNLHSLGVLRFCERNVWSIDLRPDVFSAFLEAYVENEQAIRDEAADQS